MVIATKVALVDLLTESVANATKATLSAAAGEHPVDRGR